MTAPPPLGRRTWDEDDLRIIRSLQLAPRASFARIGEVIGLHERTVARRYGALRREGILRVFGVVNPTAVGQQVWQIRVRCRPDASEALAAALAARDDIAWVGLTAAGAEVSFSIRSLSVERRDLLLTRSLPRSAHVLDIDAAVVLHVFLGLNAHDWSGLAEHLSDEEAARLADVPPADVSGGRFELAPHDHPMLSVLARDGRAGIARLASAAGISEGRVARRLATLMERQVVLIDVDLATDAFGYDVGARLHLRVVPSRLHEVGEAAARMPEVGFAAAMSGRDNLIVAATCRDLAHLYEFTSGTIGALEGVQAMEVVPFSPVVKRSGGLVVDGRLVDPA